MRKETGTLEGRQAIVSAEWCGREPVAEETRSAAGQQRSSMGIWAPSPLKQQPRARAFAAATAYEVGTPHRGAALLALVRAGAGPAVYIYRSGGACWSPGQGIRNMRRDMFWRCFIITYYTSLTHFRDH